METGGQSHHDKFKPALQNVLVPRVQDGPRCLKVARLKAGIGWQPAVWQLLARQVCGFGCAQHSLSFSRWYVRAPSGHDKPNTRLPTLRGGL
jgi:hypothetical protein